MPANVDSDVLAPLCVGLALAVITTTAVLYAFKREIKAVTASNDELTKKLAKEIEDRKDHVKGIDDYYHREVERHQKEIDRLHDGIDRVILKTEQQRKVLEDSWVTKAASDFQKLVDGLNKK